MGIYSLHFARVSDLITVERRLIRAFNKNPTLLPKPYRALYRYAVNLAKIGWLRCPDGTDVSLADDLMAYRQWLRNHLMEIAPEGSQPSATDLIKLAPLVAVRIDTMRAALVVRYVNRFNAECLDREIRFKKMALVLGGGGGSGMAHLGMFSLLDEMGVIPDLIVGSSMGSLVGLLRALRRDYDGVATLLALPRKLDLGDIFKPFAGKTRFGFPGAFDMHLVPMASKTIRSILSQRIPTFDELPIRLEVVATGVRTGIDMDAARLEKELKRAGSAGFMPWDLRSKVRLFFKVVRQLASNPKFLTQVVFNDLPGTEKMRVIDAVGFSCSVPGLLHFDLFDEDPTTVKSFERVFEEQGLFRLTDGGIINNVPSRVAWESVQKGKLGSRNALIFALDPFAPVPNSNAMFIPVQRLARPGVLANRPYSDFTHTLRHVPSPINFAPGFRHLQRLVKHVRKDLAEDALFIKRMLTPIPRYEQWISELHLEAGQYLAAS